ncbi:DUF4870 domain-containing protein [Vibrio rumoiensis]|uniref:DUF4870 domain-containing protein n=1 Tax=Vibrio rumoiensis TaxID=76258 RepID=UPI0009FD7BAE
MNRGNSNVVAMIMWGLSIFFSILSGLLFFLLRRHDPYVHAQAKESLNWGITLFLVVLLISFFEIRILFTLLGAVHLCFCLLGVVSSLQGKPYQVPISLRFIK